MAEQNGFDKTKYTLKDLSAAELKALIDGFPGGDDGDYTFLAALLDEYASRPESGQSGAEEAKARCMESLVPRPEKAARHSSRRPVRIAVAAAAAAAVLAGSALAIGRHTDFFRNVFGVSAAVETPAASPGMYSYTDGGKGVMSYTLPGYQLVDIDEVEADRLLGPYVKEMNDVYTCGSYTVTLLGYIEDEAGTYRVYYSIENPDGLENVSLYEYNGRMYLDFVGSDDFRVLAGGSWVSVDAERSTETKVYACAPGAVGPVPERGAEIKIMDGYGDVETVAVTADKTVPAVILENGDYRAIISPMGAKVCSLRQPEGLGVQLREFSLSLSDGTVFAVYQSGAENNTTYTVSGGDAENSESFCFNRLIDPETVTGATIDGTVIPRN